MANIIRYLSLLALLGSVAWLAQAPEWQWEPAISTLVSLGAFLSSDAFETKRSQAVLSRATAVLNVHEAERILSDRLVYLLRHMAQATGGLPHSTFGKVLAEWEFKDNGQTYGNLAMQGKLGWDKASEYACELLVPPGLVQSNRSEVLITQAGRELIASPGIRANYVEASNRQLIPL